MRTCTFKSILDGIAALYGESSLTADDRSFAATMIDSECFAEAWAYADWPELETIEQRFYADFWDKGTTYSGFGNLVYHEDSDAYYTNSTSPTTGNTPSLLDHWRLSTDHVTKVPYVQTGKTSIGTLNAVTKLDPRLSASAAEVAYVLRDGYAQILDPQQTSVWCQFTRREPRVTGTAYASGTTYAEGDVVYDATTGQCYESLTDSNTGNAVTDTDNWQLQEIPYFLRSYLIRAALSGLYLSKEKLTRADRNAAMAQDKLSEAYHEQKQRTGQHDRASYVNSAPPLHESATTA